MRILFATYRLHFPDDVSGSVQSTHALALGLHQRGQVCEVVASLPRRWQHFAATAISRASGQRVILEWTDVQLGYPVHRGSEWRFASRVQTALHRFRPDVVVLDSLRQVKTLRASGIGLPCSCVVMIHDPNFAEEIEDLAILDGVQVVANSPYTADRVKDRYGLRIPVIPPVVNLSSYQTERSNAQCVTLVSPNSDKGVELVLELATALPMLPFLLVEGWPLGRQEWGRLKRQTAHLGNVRVRRSARDMMEIYRSTRVLLVPSQVAETFGRVVIEAQVSGIPSIVRNIGSLPWTVGEGGIIMPVDAGVAQWSEELARLFNDQHHYDLLSSRARANASRVDFQPTESIQRFERLLQSMNSPLDGVPYR